MTGYKDVHHAVEMDDIEAVRQFLADGADVEALELGFSLLKHALDTEIVNAHSVDGNGERGWHVDLTALLLASGADPLLRGGEPSKSAAETAEQRHHWLATELFDGWARRGERRPTLRWPAKANARRRGEDAHFAVAVLDVDALRQALTAGADVEQEQGGRSLLQHAVDIETVAGDRHVDLIALILAYGADPLRPAGERGISALDLARESGHWLAVTLFEGWTRRPN